MEALIVEPFSVLAALAVLSAIGFYTDDSSLGRKVPGVMLTLVLSMLTANLGIMPRSSIIYDAVWHYAVPLAIPLLLLNVNLRYLFKQVGEMLLPFVNAVLGTMAGTCIAIYFLDLGSQAAGLAAVFAATFIGGSVNFYAVSRAVGLEDEALLASAIAVDTLAGIMFLAILLLLPASQILVRMLGAGKTTPATEEPGTFSDTVIDPFGFSLQLVALLGVSATICAFAKWFAAVLGTPSLDMLYVTFLTVILATAFQRQLQRLTLASSLGMALMYSFFVAVAASADLSGVLEVAPVMGAFVAIILGVHLLVSVIAARLMGIDIARLIVASNACVLGPPAAAAVAGGRGWYHLISPGIVCGVLGYVVANFMAMLLYALFL